jgi:transcriptional regulator with XRE-family HTH domain
MSQDNTPSDVAETLAEMGRRIALARRRRNWNQDAFAKRLGVVRQTLSRLERGDPAIAIGLWVRALWVLGLDDSLAAVARPGEDKVGIFHDEQRRPKRVRTKVDKGLDF